MLCVCEELLILFIYPKIDIQNSALNVIFKLSTERMFKEKKKRTIIYYFPYFCT